MPAATLGLVLVEHANVLQRLRRETVLARCLRHIAGIRGLNAMVVVAPETLFGEAKKAARAVGAAVAVAKLGSGGWWHDAEKLFLSDERYQAETVLFLRPALPFLPTAKMEACLHKVQRGAACAATVQRAQNVAVIFPSGDRLSKRGAFVEVPGCRAISRQQRPVTCGFAPVELEPVESLDVTEHDGLRLATIVAKDTRNFSAQLA